MIALLALFSIAAAEPGCPKGPARDLRGVRDHGVQAACTLKATYLRRAAVRGKDFFQTFEAGISRGRRVTLLGIEHFNFEEELYPKLLAKAREANPDIDCYFVENELDSPKAKRALDLFNAGDSSQWRTEIVGFDESWLGLLQRVRNQGVKVHFVDRPGNLTDDEAKDSRAMDDWARDRNTVMSRNIERLMKRGSCRAAFFPVGAAHLSDREGSTLPQELARRRIANDRMLLVVAGRNSREGDGPLENGTWSWREGGKSICADALPVPARSFGFVNGKARVPVYYDGERFLADYADFSRTLVYVCESEECRKFNRR